MRTRVYVTFPEELELLRLVDLQGLEQEEAGAVIGVSRRTVWKDLHEARRNVADALIHGKKMRLLDVNDGSKAGVPVKGSPVSGLRMASVPVGSFRELRKTGNIRLRKSDKCLPLVRSE